MTVKVDIFRASKPEPEPEVVDKPEPEPEVVAKLVSLQEEIFSQSTEVEEFPIDTSVKLSTELTKELFSPAMMFSLLSLRSSNVYDLLQIFLQETGSQDIRLLMM